MSPHPTEPQTELLPCPSGHADAALVIPGGGYVSIACNGGVAGGLNSQCTWRVEAITHADAIAAWNRRSAPAAPSQTHRTASPGRIGSPLAADATDRYADHPWFGPCDGFGEGGECSECERLSDVDYVVHSWRCFASSQDRDLARLARSRDAIRKNYDALKSSVVVGEQRLPSEAPNNEEIATALSEWERARRDVNDVFGTFNEIGAACSAGDKLASLLRSSLQQNTKGDDQ